MSAIINSFFTNAGIPVSGLTPTIRIWEIDGGNYNLVIGAPNGSSVSTDGNMVEVVDNVGPGTGQSDGFYSYVFTTANGYATNKTYLFRVDGGNTLTPNERYHVGSTDDFNVDNVVDAVWDEPTIDHATIGTTGKAVSDIDATTQQIQIDLAVVDDLVRLLIKYESNRTKIDQTAKTLTVYDDDGITPIRVFDLKDFGGLPSVVEITERDPI